MTERAKWIGLAAAAGLVLLLGFNLLREPYRQRDESDTQRHAAIERATVLYTLHCVECHGAFGEGLNLNPALNERAVRRMDRDDIYTTIERGRPTTAMVAFGQDENGLLTPPQIDDLTTLILEGSWRQVQAYIENQGLTPTQVPPIEQQFDVAALTYPLEEVSEGRQLYLANCFSCHNVSGGAVTGHSIGKDLADNEFVQEKSDDELLAFVNEGRAEDDPVNVTGYEMPPKGGNPYLTDAEIYNIIAYMKELNNNTVLITAPSDEVTTTSGAWNGRIYEWELIADGFDSPVLVTHAGDGSDRLFVVEQTGFILVIEDGQVRPEPFLDVVDLLPLAVYSGSYTERGLLGLAFHPDYAQNGQFFISYSNPQGHSVIARYHVSADDPNRADPASAEILLTVEQPFEDHNGGNITFGPDGYLYIGLGDGGNPAQPNYNSQNPQQYLGKMLRVDVDSGDPYGIPPDNPFVDDPAYLPEIWAMGLRNPWRFTFDRATGDMYIGDVGQWLYEELNFQPGDSPGGENYGWSAFEATHPYLEDETVRGEHTPPIIEYSHDIGLSITGGYVYRGADVPTLQGYYIYADYIGGLVWAAWRDAAGAWQHELMMDTSLVISSFGEDAAGELYAVDYKGGIYRLADGGPVPPPDDAATGDLPVTAPPATPAIPVTPAPTTATPTAPPTAPPTAAAPEPTTTQDTP